MREANSCREILNKTQQARLVIEIHSHTTNDSFARIKHSVSMRSLRYITIYAIVQEKKNLLHDNMIIHLYEN